MKARVRMMLMQLKRLEPGRSAEVDMEIAADPPDALSPEMGGELFERTRAFESQARVQQARVESMCQEMAKLRQNAPVWETSTPPREHEILGYWAGLIYLASWSDGGNGVPPAWSTNGIDSIPGEPTKWSFIPEGWPG